MKKNEIAFLVLIVGVVGMITYFLVNTLATGLQVQPVSVDKADPIDTSVVSMDTLGKQLFVEGAYNPTIKVKIGDQSNQQPFNATQ